jgi:N-methylhydantoinase B
LEAGWLVEMTATEALSKLVALSDTLMREGQAAPAGGPDQFVYSGINAHGDRFTHVILDCLATGGGAYCHRDGVWTQGQHNIERQRISNAEELELETPLLYLSRGLAIDSGGAGTTRGGMSIGGTYVAHGGQQLQAVLNGHGWEAPNSTGIFGGYPGTQNDREIVTASNVADLMSQGIMPTHASQIDGQRPTMHGRQGQIKLANGDVMSNVHQAGGGWGDPLGRDVAHIAADLRDGAVSPAAAIRLYGVVFTDGADGATADTIDIAATAAHRAALRDQRRSWAPASTTASVSVPGPLTRRGPFGTHLNIVETADGQGYVACACGHVLSTVAEPWRAGACEQRSTDVSAFSRSTRLNEMLEIREYACPACGVLLSTDVARVGSPLQHDIQMER